MIGYGAMMNPSDPELLELGWKPFFRDQLSSEESARFQPMRVMAVHRGKPWWDRDAKILSLRVCRTPMPRNIKWQSGTGWPSIQLCCRFRAFSVAKVFKRRAPGSGRKLQLIAANVDTVFIVASCNQDFNLARLERYLILAREVGVRPVVVLTKADLTEAPDEFVKAARGLQPGLDVEIVNGRDPVSAASLATFCGVGQTVALLGSSGVGKSTLINTLLGSRTIATQEVREADGKGRHTTTVREMHRLAKGGWLLDTPGMRELQLSDAAAGLAVVFADVFSLAQQCKFSNCTHNSEPSCAIRKAQRDGTLSADRLDRFRKLMAEDDLNTLSLADRPAAPLHRHKRRRG